MDCMKQKCAATTMHTLLPRILEGQQNSTSLGHHSGGGSDHRPLRQLPVKLVYKVV